MRKLVALVASAALLAAVAATAASKPAVVLVKRQPLELRGTHFLPGATIRVTVTRTSTAAKWVRIVHATKTGSFTIAFGVLQGYDRCADGLLVVASGVHRTARLNIAPVECAPA
jgi:hypothetical protein